MILQLIQPTISLTGYTDQLNKMIRWNLHVKAFREHKQSAFIILSVSCGCMACNSPDYERTGKKKANPYIQTMVSTSKSFVVYEICKCKT